MISDSVLVEEATNSNALRLEESQMQSWHNPSDDSTQPISLRLVITLNTGLHFYTKILKQPLQPMQKIVNVSSSVSLSLFSSLSIRIKKRIAQP